MFVTLALLALLPAILYLFLVWNYDHWRKRGVYGPKPKLLLGSFPNMLAQKQHFADDFTDIYRKFKSTENFVGVFMLRIPQLLVLNPEIAHDVFVNAFKYFHDNDMAKFIDKKRDPLIAKNPFLLSGHEWKEQRALVSPGMTGTRIRTAYACMQKVCQNLVEYIKQESKIVNQAGIDGKELALRFTSDNVAESVLGINAKSFTPDAIPIPDNVRKFAELNTAFMLYTLIAGLFPNIHKIWSIKFIPKSCEAFFLDLMQQAFRLRNYSAAKTDRQDFLNHLMTLREKKNLTDIELASHSMTFLIDGLETTATVIAHTLLLLARYPETQDLLRAEIQQNLNEDEQLSFDKLNELPYLDACVHESLRMFPPALWSSKTCTLPYEFTHKNGKKLQLQPGDTIVLPIYALHLDEQYYAEAEHFRPERFLPENGGHKKYQDMGVFLGFGDGPRMCLGMRFALCQTKAALTSIVQHFHIKENAKSEPGIKLDPKAFLAAKKGGIWLDFESIA